MGLGPSFINVLDDASADTAEDPLAFRSANTLGERLQRLIEVLPSNRRWTLYLSRSGVMDRDIDLPANLVLVCAPRVVVFLTRGVTLTVRGPVDLGRERRFALGEGAHVWLLGALDAILPIWWRVSEADDDAPAVEAAVATVLRRADEGRPQAPVVLDRPYTVRRSVEIAWEGTTGEDGRREVILHGRHPLGASVGPASLNGVGTSSLLKVRGQVRLELVGVGLFATEVPEVEPTEPEALIEMVGEFDGSSIERCTFHGWRQSFIRLRRLPRASIQDQREVAEALDGQETPSVIDPERLAAEIAAAEGGSVRIDRCVMRRSSRFVADDGVAVLRGARVLLSVTTSSFQSNAGSVVAMACGHLTIEDCRFDIEASEDKYLDQMNTVQKAPARGEKVVLSRLWAAIVAGELVGRALVVGRRVGPAPVELGGVSVVATHLQVNGLAALAGAPRSREGTEMHLTLNNVVQYGTPAGEFSIDLRGAPVNGTLMLQGCVFAGYVLAFEANHGDFQVIDVGTRYPPRTGILTANTVRRLSRTPIQG